MLVFETDTSSTGLLPLSRTERATKSINLIVACKITECPAGELYSQKTASFAYSSRYGNKSFPSNKKTQRKQSQAPHGVYAYLFTQVNALEVYAYLRDSDCSRPHRWLSLKLELLYNSKLELNCLLHGRWRALHCNRFQ